MVDKSEAERMAEEMMNRVKEFQEKPVRGHDVSAVTALTNSLITHLQKDRDLRKWALELAAKSSPADRNVVDVADEIFKYANTEAQKVIDMVKQ